MKAIRYLFLLCLIVAISCTKEQKIEKTYPAFIYSYYHIYGTFNNEDTSKIAQNVYLEGSPSVRAIRLNLMGQCHVTADDYLSGTTTQSEQFLDLCNKFGDWCPNGYTYKYDPRYDLFEDISHDVCKDVITDIKITSQQDWDDIHTAGAILNDCFIVKYKSYKSHIESGYKTPTEFEIVSEQISNIESIYLADLRYMIFYPQSMPINKGTYDINIHIVLEDEREFDYPAQYTFE
ncbi:MAG: hypothetical protein E7133_06730 [Rikenellaceae bacterium]|nr:hypothetical protein [Rikenellaceae bacterium]